LDRNATGKRRTYVTILRQSPQSKAQNCRLNERFSADRGNKTTVRQTCKVTNSSGLRGHYVGLPLTHAGPFEIDSLQLAMSFGNVRIGCGNRPLLLLSGPASEVDPVMRCHGTPPCLEAHA
jgi:hypothetical protein